MLHSRLEASLARLHCIVVPQAPKAGHHQATTQCAGRSWAACATSVCRQGAFTVNECFLRFSSLCNVSTRGKMMLAVNNITFMAQGNRQQLEAVTDPSDRQMDMYSLADSCGRACALL
jgi:hypothetical protein